MYTALRQCRETACSQGSAFNGLAKTVTWARGKTLSSCSEKSWQGFCLWFGWFLHVLCDTEKSSTQRIHNYHKHWCISIRCTSTTSGTSLQFLMMVFCGVSILVGFLGCDYESRYLHRWFYSQKLYEHSFRQNTPSQFHSTPWIIISQMHLFCQSWIRAILRLGYCLELSSRSSGYSRAVFCHVCDTV